MTRRAWNWNQLTPRVESGMRGTRLRRSGNAEARPSELSRQPCRLHIFAEFCLSGQDARWPHGSEAGLALDGCATGISSAKATLMQQQPETQQVAWLVPRPA